MFKLQTKLKPTGGQPDCIKNLTQNLKGGKKFNTLLGVTGSGKTFVMSHIIKNLQKPTLILSHNKTLAAQLYQEFKEFFPKNPVHYFVSYYDYYQPEAYIPQTDTYIEKDAKINETIDRLRHAAVQSVLSRNDTIIIASVSAIYNIGSPEYYQKISFTIKRGIEIKRRDLLKTLVRLQYERNDFEFIPGKFRIRENIINIFSPTGKEIIKLELEGSRISRILICDLETKNNFSETIYGKFKEKKEITLFPAKFWLSPQDKLEIALKNIEIELSERIHQLKKVKKLLEAERLKKRTEYDLSMIKEIGWCHGIENYSAHLEFRKPGSPPFTLIDYFPKDFITFIDESHQTIPQLKAMYEGDKKRKKTLIEYGFRLPSALDNRPLKFKEFIKKIREVVFVSATPGKYEIEKSKKENSLVELIIRPTGLLDPKIEIKPAKNQIQDLIKELEKAISKKERILVTTLTKRLAEDITDFLKEKNFKVHYLHSEIKTLDRPGILRDLRLGKYDVIVGINLLREGLDLPEVALVAILDADREGFLRNETTLIQTMGRVARHPSGRVILYADKITTSIKRAIKETERRRKIQEIYNKKHNITPQAIKKSIREWGFDKKEEILPQDILELAKLKDMKALEKEMKIAARNLDFERAAKIRDEIFQLKNSKKF